MKYLLSHKFFSSVVVSVLFCVFVLPITESAWFSTANLSQNALLYATVLKFIFGVALFFTVHFILSFYEKVRSKDSFYISWLKNTLTYGAILFVLFLLVFPGYWLWDEFFILEQTRMYALYSWQHIFTQVQYVLSLYLIPTSTGVTIVQLAAVSVIIGYVLACAKKLLGNARGWVFALVAVLLPAVLFAAFFTLRLHIYGFLVLLLLVKILVIYKDAKPLKPAYFHFIGFTAIITLLAFWRSEGLVYLVTLPFIAHRLGLLSFNTKTLAKTIGTFAVALAILLTGYLATKLTESPRYKITASVNPLSMMIHENLRGDKIDIAWQEIDTVLNVDILRNYPSFTEIPALWRANDEPILREGYEDNLDTYYRGFRYILLHNPEVFAKYRIKTFLATNAMSDHPYATSTGWLTPFSTGGCETLDTYQCKTLTTFSDTNALNYPLSPQLRENTLEVLLMGTDNQSWFQRILRGIFWNVSPILVGLVALAIHAFIKRRFLWTFLSVLLLLHSLLVFVAAPASYFMYYFPVYIAGAFLLALYFGPALHALLSRKRATTASDSAIMASMQNNPHKILIAIPAYNCADQITRVLDEIDDKLYKRVAEIAVIDNGSPDDTVQRVLDYKKTGKLKGKLHVYENTANYNLGGTHKVAFGKALKEKFTHVVILHGDNQAKSNEANDLIDFAESHPQQTVLGSRFNSESRLNGYDWKRIAGNKVLNAIYTTLTLRHLEDLGSGLNLFYMKDLDKNTYLKFADKLTFNFELILDLVKRKVNFAYLPITWREEDQISNARNFNIFKTALVNLLRWRAGKPSVNEVQKSYTCKEVK